MSKDPSIIVDNTDNDYLQSRYSIEKILKRHPTSSFCKMGASSFAVDTRGDIYPCQILVGIDKFKIGNVYEDIEKLKGKLSISYEYYSKRANKSKYDECKECYLKYLCGDCPARNYIMKGTIKKTFENCHRHKEKIEELVLKYANDIEHK